MHILNLVIEKETRGSLLEAHHVFCERLTTRPVKALLEVISVRHVWNGALAKYSTAVHIVGLLRSDIVIDLGASEVGML
jgi:hypothetical protein